MKICSLTDNGSPPPNFNTDDNRTYFEVELLVHPAFRIDRAPTVAEVKTELAGIDKRINQLIETAPQNIRDKVRDIAGDIAGDVAGDIAGDVAGDVAGDIAGDIVRDADREITVQLAIDVDNNINEKVEKILNFCKKPKQRKEVMQEIGLVNNVKNYNSYLAPLLQLSWVVMTIPDKPTSPKQQYLTTLKGRLILEFLKHTIS